MSEDVTAAFDKLTEVLLSEQKLAAIRAKAIVVWRFDDAPQEWQDLSTNGGDEDWLAFVPDCLNAAWIPWIETGTAFGCCDVSQYPVNGGTIHIGSHA